MSSGNQIICIQCRKNPLLGQALYLIVCVDVSENELTQEKKKEVMKQTRFN